MYRSVMSTVRRRVAATSGSNSREKNGTEEETTVQREVKMEGDSYWLTRIVFIRAIGFIYCEHALLIQCMNHEPSEQEVCMMCI